VFGKNKVLKGHRILITRECTADYKPLEEQSGDLFVFPTIQAVTPEDHRDLDRSIGNLREYNWLVFTSKNGVDFFVRRLLENGYGIDILSALAICAVGSGTAVALSHYGLKADIVPKRFSAEGLIDTFARPEVRDKHLKGISFLFPKAEAARDVLPSKIRELGGTIDTPIAYRTVIPQVPQEACESILAAGITIATFTSGSTFTNFINMVGPGAIPFLARTAIAVIGPVTQRSIEETGLPVSIIPPKATIKSMVKAIIEWADKT
jgi:uroporphyrinogen III methyltransferase / synthase